MRVDVGRMKEGEGNICWICWGDPGVRVMVASWPSVVTTVEGRRLKSLSIAWAMMSTAEETAAECLARLRSAVAMAEQSCATQRVISGHNVQSETWLVIRRAPRPSSAWGGVLDEVNHSNARVWTCVTAT